MASELVRIVDWEVFGGHESMANQPTPQWLKKPLVFKPYFWAGITLGGVLVKEWKYLDILDNVNCDVL